MMMKIMMKMIRPECKFWYVLLSFRSASCVLCLWKRKKNRVSPPCQRWKYFARFSWSRFAEGDAARQLGSIGVFNSLRSLIVSICTPQFSLTLLKVPHSQHISINNQPWMMILTALKLFPQSQEESFKIWFKPCDDGTQRRIGKWLQFSENVINQLWRGSFATISCSERGKTRWRLLFSE